MVNPIEASWANKIPKKEEEARPETELFQDRDTEQLSQRAVEIFLDAFKKKEGTFVTAFCGGRSAVNFYKRLAESIPATDIGRLHIFLIDERFNNSEGTYDKTDRNADVIEENIVRDLVEKHNFPAGNFHRLPEGEDVAKVVNEYNSVLRGISPDLKFDLVVLGAGEDGHVAGIFPGKETVKSDRSEFLYLEDSPKYPNIRITASPDLIRNSDNALLFFMGEGKRDAFGKFRAGGRAEDCPASLVHDAGKGYVFSDIME